MANFVCFLAARAAEGGATCAPAAFAPRRPLRVYASTETHTWIQKAADLFGLGTDAIRWIPVGRRTTDGCRRARTADCRRPHERRRCRCSSSAPPARSARAPSIRWHEIAACCRRHDVWFHVDGAYGALAARVPGAPDDLRAIADADSVAVDPHKWLYAPLEAGCALVRRPAICCARSPTIRATTTSIRTSRTYFDYGPQNSRGFRALKVWLGAAPGRAVRLSADDRRRHAPVAASARARAAASGFRGDDAAPQHHHVPLRPARPAAGVGARRTPSSICTGSIEQLLTRVEQSGEAFLSNAMVNGRFALRACIVNFRTSLADIEALPDVLARHGREVDRRCAADSSCPALMRAPARAVV